MTTCVALLSGGGGALKAPAFTLAEGATHVAMLNSLSKYAFTLAEVLVTLGIIGVVAAMTMPTLINNHRRIVFETQFKAAHSIINQAVLSMGNDNIDLNKYYCGNNARNDATTHDFIKNFANYVQVVKSDYGETRDLTKLGYKKSYFNQSAPGWHNFNPDSHNDGAIFLKNGMMIASSGCWWSASYLDFIVDTNGTKGPNKFGYDLFYFQIGPDNRLYPSSGDYSYATTDDKRLACCNFKEANTCSVPEDTGVSCAQYALQNAWPHDSKKTYWENIN